jgi:hypothetical protein
MKKDHLSMSRLVLSRQNYFREIGEKAALEAFKRRGESKKLETLSPQLKRVLSPEQTTRSLKELKILQDLSPRDVSHLRDRLRSPASRLVDLPAGLEDLKKMMSSSFQGSKKDLSEDSLNFQSIDKFSIETLAFTCPSSRQSSENLRKWLIRMRANYCVEDLFGENALIIHSFCSNELIKLVSVTCNEQGIVLKEVIQFFRSFVRSLTGKMQEIEMQAEENSKKILNAAEEKEKCYKEDLAQLQMQVEAGLKKLGMKKGKVLKLRSKVERLEILIDELKGKTEKDDNKLRVSYIRRGTLVNRNQGHYDTLSPMTERRNERFRDFFDFPITSNSQSQTERPVLEVQTENDFFYLNGQDALQGTQDLNKPEEESQNLPNINVEILDESLKTEHSGLSHKSPALPSENGSQKKKNSKNKTRVMNRKDMNLKQMELDRKLQEKQHLLDKIKSKLKIKAAELDFLTKTLHYKKVKETFLNNQHFRDNSGITIEKLFQLKPANSKNFNILADSEFWGEKEKSIHSFSLNKSLTQTFSGLPPEKTARLNTIKEPSVTEDPEESIIIQESIRKSIFTELESFQDTGPDKSFMKKPISALENLHEKVDIFLLQREKSEKKTQAVKILEKICEKDLDWIKSKALMNRKLINKLIFSLYLSFYTRHDFSEDFLDFVYYDFFKRYGLKYVSDKKFVEFICSMIKSEDSKKFVIFLRFLGAGQKIGKVNYSRKTFEYFLEGLSFLINSKIGVSFNEDYSDKFQVPLNRALELARTTLEGVDKQAFLKTYSILESKAHPDPKRFNIGGLVDGETALEVIIEGYESTKFKFISGVEFLVNVLKYNEPKDVILKAEILMFLRIAYPNDLEAFEVFFDDCESFSLDLLCYFAIDRKILALSEIQNFIKDQGEDLEDVEALAKESIQEMKSILNDLNNLETFMKTLPQQVWQVKISNFENGVKIRRPYESVFAFKVFLLELLRVQSTFL